MTHKGKCVGGPLDGREFAHDYYQFQYPVEIETRSMFEYADVTAPSVTTLSYGVYSFDQDTQKWNWKL